VTVSDNIIFPQSYPFKKSSYKDAYKIFDAEKINFKELDAYRDKFKYFFKSYFLDRLMFHIYLKREQFLNRLQLETKNLINM
jgi:hypothetical protein